jgi:tetratricopeptide (TPR) repeat protein
VHKRNPTEIIGRQLIVISLALALVQSLTAQAISSEAMQHWNAARDAESRKQFDVAVAEYQKVTELEPKVPMGFVSLGQVYVERGDYGGAIQPLKRALELDAGIAPAHQLLGYALLAQGYATEAIPHLETAHETGALGIAQLETGRFVEAITNLQAALQKRPNDPDLLYYLGRASGLLSKQSNDILLAAYPDSARAHQSMAENLLVLRRTDEAQKEYEEALKLRPDTPHLHLELGQVFALASRWTQAEEQFRAESLLQPGNAEAAYRLGDALLRQGKAREAQSALELSNKLQPQMPETLYSLGKAESLGGNTTAAEKSWLQLLSIEKEGELAAQTHFALAALYRKQGKTAEADREMKEFQRLRAAVSPPSNEKLPQ